ncbi:hypothetical protein BJ684DRAFT_21046 [Piptocephalis cylindrospora]|uniref:LYR motif-containing protein Cup1-like N-terminal domain-containing protein n=1 Tax=Piptocephalis cylindrospora TaxID=1907219 RepID=A0A4P9Y3M4_9FUNG|nr:hypothetical protein BJ684DRAFT_21046 [Piptocephalis cylindrospora]|eukprot:RKP12410.1 hypothetical protein BJ684DRAFT_21046 [Piptocephalis cylindrospora]
MPLWLTLHCFAPSAFRRAVSPSHQVLRASSSRSAPTLPVMPRPRPGRSEPNYTLPPTALRAGRLKIPVVPHDASKVRSLYRALLREAGHFWDDRTRIYMLDRIKERFHTYAHWTWAPRVVSKLRDARRSLRIIKGANDGDRKHIQRILQMAYGRCGLLRHEFLKPFMKPPADHPPPTEPNPRLSPMTPELLALLTHYSKRLITPLPERRVLTNRRRARLQERHHKRNLKRVQAPLPEAILREVESKAQARACTQYQTKISVKEARRRRRHFQLLLKSIPILTAE